MTGATYCTGSGCDPTGAAAWSSPFDLGTLAAGATVIVRIGASVPADTIDGTTIVNTATVSSATTEIDPSDDSATISTTVSTTADLAITVTGPATTAGGIRAGLDYGLSIGNSGPADNVGGFTVTDSTPRRPDVPADGSDPACSASGQDVRASISPASRSVRARATSSTPSWSGQRPSAACCPLGLGRFRRHDRSGPSNDTSVALVTTVMAAIPVPPAPETAIESITRTIDAGLVGIAAILVLVVGAGLIAGAYLVARRPG